MAKKIISQVPTHEELMAWISGEGLVHHALVTTPNEEPPEDEEEDDE